MIVAVGITQGWWLGSKVVLSGSEVPPLLISRVAVHSIATGSEQRLLPAHPCQNLLFVCVFVFLITAILIRVGMEFQCRFLFPWWLGLLSNFETRPPFEAGLC